MGYDGFTARYTFACPTGRRPSVRLSAFRAVEQLPGTARPAVYEVRFACPCGTGHSGLLTHDQLDWEPLGASTAPYFDVMTGQVESSAGELAAEAAYRIKQGLWPWAFYCYAESCVRPVFPSAFRVLEPEHGRMLVAVRCPSCRTTSVNVVSQGHLDLPFCTDAEIEVVDHVFDPDAEDDLAGLAAALSEGPFPCTRHALAGRLSTCPSRQG